MNESDNVSLEQTALELEKPQQQKQPDSSNRQITNMDYSDYVALLMESRIIQRTVTAWLSPAINSGAC